MCHSRLDGVQLAYLHALSDLILILDDVGSQKSDKSHHSQKHEYQEAEDTIENSSMIKQSNKEAANMLTEVDDNLVQDVQDTV